jgi:hypothetical protein
MPQEPAHTWTRGTTASIPCQLIHGIAKQLGENKSRSNRRKERNPLEINKGHKYYLLVVLVLDELDDNVLVGLDLQHLECEAEERSWLAIPSVAAAGMVELHGLVDQRLRGEPEALLLPVDALVDF